MDESGDLVAPSTDHHSSAREGRSSRLLSRRPRGQRSLAKLDGLDGTSRQLELALAAASDEQNFLRIYLDKTAGHPTDSALKLATRAGYRTSSFISECLRGRRPLPAAAVEPLSQALLVPESLKRLFVALARLARPVDLRATAIIEETEQSVRRLRERIRSELSSGPEASRSIVQTLDHFTVFAALESDRWLTEDEIIQRSNLPLASVKTCLLDLRSISAVEIMGSGEELGPTSRSPNCRYRLTAEHLAMMGPRFASAFKTCFLQTLRLVNQRAEVMEANPEDLFFQTTFQIESANLRRLQDRIQDVLVTEVESAAQSGGGQIAHLICGLIRR
jgi:hypothetical protein